MDIGLELDDLPFPSTLRAVSEGLPGCYIAVNRLFLDLCGIDEAPNSPASFTDGSAASVEEIDRRIVNECEIVECEIWVRGRALVHRKTPIVRSGHVVAILTVMAEPSGVHGPEARAPQTGRLDVAGQFRLRWFERLTDIAASSTVAVAAERAFAVLGEDLGLGRAVLLRFDGHVIDVVAHTIDVSAPPRMPVSEAELQALRLPGLIRILDPRRVPDFLTTLGIESGVAVAIENGGESWGTLVASDSSARPPMLNPEALSMLESLGSTLSMLIERDATRRLLQESNRRLEAYAYAAAHDLRSPLRRIRSFSQLLRARLALDDIDRDELGDFAERIANGAERLDALLESMLEHAAISTLARESDEYSDLQAIADTICEGVLDLSQEPKPAFSVSGLPEVRLPHDAAERVLRNLIDNALKYSPKDRTASIEISADRSVDGCRVYVRDNGIGIDPQFADKVFQLFNQLSTEETGSGVGLAVVERLLLTRDAKIWVESEVGQGATFVIDFPATALRPTELLR